MIKTIFSRIFSRYISRVQETFTPPLYEDEIVECMICHILTFALLVGLYFAYCFSLTLGISLTVIFVLPFVLVAVICNLPDKDDNSRKEDS